MVEKGKTPMLDELERGPWPSFVREIKRAGRKKEAPNDLLKQLELSYKDKVTHWKHGGVVGVRGYGGGVIGRYSDSPEEFPNIAAFHTFRVNQPSGWFYTTKALRQICDIWERFGSGLTNFHGSTGDLILLGAPSENIQPCFDALTEEAGFDLGGSASVLRTPSACVGPARCEYACIDTLDLCNDITHTFQDYIHRPHWGYKFKIKISGCPNDCVAAIARADLPIVGTWRGALRIDQDAVREYVNNGFDIENEVVRQCPTEALEWDANLKELRLRAEECVRCMHCINMMPKALRPGVEKGATILIGGKAPLVKGARLGWVLIPFMKLEPPYTELKDLLERIWDWWDEHAMTRERVAELIERLGMAKFLKAIGIEPCPEMVWQPRTNAFIF
ncbi:MAG: dissimilatory-type sulfite reductase subunit alpha [Deltaproteobacteria bacterium]|nr:MAG: dissimilatory-type sulfite reductase subunit alpha [Deltaproteobacteria bacterium]